MSEGVGIEDEEREGRRHTSLNRRSGLPSMVVCSSLVCPGSVDDIFVIYQISE
jgi:hypothetical protein